MSLVAAAPLLGRAFAGQRALAGLPGERVGQNARHVGEVEIAHRHAQRRVDAVAGIHQHHATRQSGLAGPADLVERDLRLGLELDLLGHTGLGPARSIVDPLLRQVEPMRHRQARVIVDQRQRHGHLAVVLLAELPAVLPRDADRMAALLRKACVVDDPCADGTMPLDARQHHLAHLGEHLLVRPLSLADEMQQRLMLRRRSLRRRHRRHRLHALPLRRQQQTDAVVVQRSHPVGMADHAGKTVDVRFQSLVAVSPRAPPHRARSPVEVGTFATTGVAIAAGCGLMTSGL